MKYINNEINNMKICSSQNENEVFNIEQNGTIILKPFTGEKSNYFIF